MRVQDKEWSQQQAGETGKLLILEELRHEAAAYCFFSLQPEGFHWIKINMTKGAAARFG